MLFEFRVDCDLIHDTRILLQRLVGMLFEFRVDCDITGLASTSLPIVGMLFEFRVDCDKIG